MHQSPWHVCAALTALTSALPTASAAAQASSGIETIDVVGATPLGGRLDADSIAANVQSATAEELREQNALDLADFMRRSLASVFVNETQNNPLQPDVQYRGFVGSPLLGLPQGLAIYQDGVRLNEPFGDTVNWALIPESAIDSVDLLPGSNPLFGLNALGGAIAIDTKNGLDNPGTRAEVFGGSFGRIGVQAETGGAFSDSLGYFVTASHLDEDGWRDFSPTRAEQIFAALTAATATTNLDVSFTYADTDLVGNGAAPVELLEQDRAAIFTHPDHTWNHLTMLNVVGEQTLTDALTVTGNLYVRSSDVRTLNGDDSDYARCAGTPSFICETDAGGEEILRDEDNDPIAFDAALVGATVNRTNTEQNSTGFGLQTAFAGTVRGRDNRLTIGLANDRSGVRFTASSELGTLNDERGAVAGGVFVGEAFTELAATVSNTGFYLTDSLTLGERTLLTLSGRYNRTAIELTDQLGDELNGDHEFTRFNPAIAITTRRSDRLTFYASYSEANRAPSPVELTCADEDDPCRLPNAFIADPPLEQVVAHTFEAGARGALGSGDWHLGVFRTTNDDDILFISAGALTSQGFFDNVGKTRRDGLELNLGGAVGERVDWSADYTFLDATFRDAFTVMSPNNPEAVDGEIAVEVGARLPLIPEHLLKVGLRVAAGAALTFGADVLANSGMFFRGDEGNRSAELEGHALLNVRAEYRLSERASLFASIDNLLDAEYETFGAFGEPDDVLGPEFADPRFLAPGAPRAAWIGFRIDL